MNSSIFSVAPMLPHDVIQEYIIPHLDLKSLLSLACISKSNFKLFLTSSDSFSDLIWKDRCYERWPKLCSSDSSRRKEETATNEMTTQLNKINFSSRTEADLQQKECHESPNFFIFSSWYITYRECFCKSKLLKNDISTLHDIINDLKQRSDNIETTIIVENLRSKNNLHDTLDRNTNLTTRMDLEREKHIIYNKLIFQIESGDIYHDEIVSLSRLENYCTASTNKMEHSSKTETPNHQSSNNHCNYNKDPISRNAMIMKTARNILVGWNRYNVIKRFQKINQIHNNDVDNNDNVNIEDGAILIGEFYQNYNDLIHSHDFEYGKNKSEAPQEGKQSFMVRRAVNYHLNVLVEKLKKRLQKYCCKHFDQNEKRTNLQHGGTREETIENILSIVPTHIIFEEMQRFFYQQSNNSSINLQRIDNDCNELNYSNMVDYDSDVAHIPLSGNHSHYYDYKNSLIHKVLSETRMGIPITLSVIYGAILRRATGIELNSVGLPGHFLLSYNSPTSCCYNTYHSRTNDFSGMNIMFIDVFNGGTIRSLTDCQSLVQNSFHIPWDDSFIQPISKSEVWKRMIRNLLNSHSMVLPVNLTSTRSDNHPLRSSYSSLSWSDNDLQELLLSQTMLRPLRYLLLHGFESSHIPSYEGDASLWNLSDFL